MTAPRYVDPRSTPTGTRPDIHNLPKPPAWTEHARCAEIGGDDWYPENGVSVTEAKAICAQCPVRTECLEYALKNSEAWGVWGGYTSYERVKLRRKAKAGGGSDAA